MLENELKELIKEALTGTLIVIRFYLTILILMLLMYKFYYHII